jgi:hypothetical protein
MTSRLLRVEEVAACHVPGLNISINQHHSRDGRSAEAGSVEMVGQMLEEGM